MIRFRLGFEIAYDFPQPTPMIALLNVHFTHVARLEWPDHLRTTPSVLLNGYRDCFGNWCTRLVAPPGRFVLSNDTIIRDDGLPDPEAPLAVQNPVESLPSETLVYLLGSRYCETDALADEAWRLFRHVPLGWQRVQAVCDFVHAHLTFGYEHARGDRTALGAYTERRGVCRDYAHLALTFCRCLNIPARYCTGYISDAGTPPPWGVGDFAAWIEVFLGDQWHVFDPRNNARRVGRVLIARGRDAADVPLTHTFGSGTLAGFRVWADEVAP
jgi:transglutaminase-like putative cysteine protease